MKWIRIQDDLPEEGQTVLIYDSQAVFHLKYKIGALVYAEKYQNGSAWVYFSDNETPKRITHWMPFPKIPKS